MEIETAQSWRGRPPVMQLTIPKYFPNRKNPGNKKGLLESRLKELEKIVEDQKREIERLRILLGEKSK
jgi:hypothetical protein